MNRAPPLRIENVALDGERATIDCEAGLIAAIHRAADAPAPDARRQPEWEALDGRGCVAHPPLINSHTHAAMTLFRGYADDLPLMEWLEKRVWPYEHRLRPEDVHAGTRLAILEMVRSGTVFFNDMYWDFAAAAAAVEEMGVRACLSRVLVDFGDSKRAATMRREIEQAEARASALSSRISHALGPHSIYTVSEESLRWAGEYARDRDLPLHIHLSETEDEVKQCMDQHGCTPVEYLDRLGVLSDRTIAAHTVWLSDGDIALLGERRAVCVDNPVANMKLAVGAVYPHRKLAEAGAVCALGTDGAGSNNNLDLLEEMKIAALLQKFHDRDPTSLPASQVLAMAVANPAAAFGLPGPDLEVGRDADLILIDTSRPAMEPSHSLTSNLVYSANGDVVDSVICAGRPLMRHRKVEGEQDIVAAARESAERLFSER